MVSALEFRPSFNPSVETEQRKALYLTPAAELSVDGQEWLAKITNGSFQTNVAYSERVVFYSHDQAGLVFPDMGGFHLLQKGRGKREYPYLDGKENTDREDAYPDAIIVFGSHAVHIVWPSQTEDITYGFAGITIMPGIHTRQIEIHEVQDMQTAENSILLQAAQVAYEHMMGSAA